MKTVSAFVLFYRKNPTKIPMEFVATLLNVAFIAIPAHTDESSCLKGVAMLLAILFGVISMNAKLTFWSLCQLFILFAFWISIVPGTTFWNIIQSTGEAIPTDQYPGLWGLGLVIGALLIAQHIALMKFRSESVEWFKWRFAKV